MSTEKELAALIVKNFIITHGSNCNLTYGFGYDNHYPLNVLNVDEINKELCLLVGKEAYVILNDEKTQILGYNKSKK